jgi:energy-coupling factor transporter ATP-binding protein EcfA2
MIKLKNFTFSYGNADAARLNRVNLAIAPGEFVLVCGATGSGKSTLLKALVGLVPHFTGGQASGSRLVDGQDFSNSMPHETAHLIGYVNQQPEGAFVADTVIEELAFALEQLGVPRDEMLSRVERALTATGLTELRDRKLVELSGGQQQRVAIAAALSAGQKILILDEPTSALDPASAHELLQFIHTLCRTEKLTAIIAEHRIERLVDLVDSVVVLSSDGTISHGSAVEQLARFSFVPPLIELAQKLSWQPIELSIESAKKRFAAINASSPKKIAHLQLGEMLLDAKDIVVNYGELRAVDGISISAREGEVIAVMGENGSGKTSLLWALRELDPRLETVAMVPQQAADLLFLNSLSEELRDSDEVADAPKASTAALLEQFSGRLDPAIHPRDLSSGQQLSLVLAMQLVKNAPLVLLDEPTRGLDYATKKQVAQVLRNLAASGKAIVFASHDVEFVAQAADRVVLLEAGRVIADEPVEQALGNHAGNPLASQIAQIADIDGVITLQQVVDDD